MSPDPSNSRCLDFDPERALPAIAYRDAEWMAAEMERIWHSDWVFATTDDVLASVGDQVPVVIGEEQVLLLRNKEQELVALSNLCAHRGTLLVEEPTNASRIQCPYHSWTYDDGGQLIGVPFAPRNWTDRASHFLPKYRVESWHGLVFVSLNPDVEPLAERFAAIEPYLTSYGIDEFVHDARSQNSEIWECNWKLSMQNAMESYHLFKVHAKTLEPLAPTRDSYYIAGSATATITGGSTKGQPDYRLFGLPPNFVGVISKDGFFWLAVQPKEVGQCAVITGAAIGRQQESLGRVGTWLSQVVESLYSQADFLPEDKAICERVQRGFTGSFTPGRILPIERVVADFGHYLNWRLNEVEPPLFYTETTSST